jgi:hypothetical protein
MLSHTQAGRTGKNLHYNTCWSNVVMATRIFSSDVKENTTRHYYSGRDKTVRFAHVISLLVEGKRIPILCKPRKHYLRQRATKYCRWEAMFAVITVYSFLSATTATPSIPLPLTANASETHGFVPTTVQRSTGQYQHCIKKMLLCKLVIKIVQSTLKSRWLDNFS